MCDHVAIDDLPARLSKRGFLLLSIIMVGCLHPANANIIEYELTNKAVKLAIVIVPRETQTPFVETVRSFGQDHLFETLIVPGPNKDQVAIQLTGDRVWLIADNPFSDAQEYHIALYRNENKSIADAEIERYWNELKRRATSVLGIDNWSDKK